MVCNADYTLMQVMDKLSALAIQLPNSSLSLSHKLLNANNDDGR